MCKNIFLFENLKKLQKREMNNFADETWEENVTKYLQIFFKLLDKRNARKLDLL